MPEPSPTRQPWYDKLLNHLPDWAAEDVREMSRAPRAIGVLLVVGAIAGSWLSGKYYGQQMASVSQQIETLREQVNLLTRQKEDVERELKTLQPEQPRYDLEVDCHTEALPPVIGYENRIEAVVFGQIGGRIVVGQYWGLVDKDDQLPWRVLCVLANRGNVPVIGVYIDFDYVVREWHDGGAKEIKGSYKHNFVLNGAVQPGEKRRFWMWTQPGDEYVSGEFGGNVLAGAHDGRAVSIPLRVTGDRVISLIPRKPVR